MLHSFTIRLIHVYKLETLYLCSWVKYQSGVILGHWGQRVIFTKNAIIRVTQLPQRILASSSA